MYEFITEKDIIAASKKPYPYPNLLSECVDTRTYKRYLQELQLRETDYQRDARAVNFNLNLISDLIDAGKITFQEALTEAKLMYEEMTNLFVIPSSRSKWVAGTSSVENNPASIFNCSFTLINRLSAFADIGNLLMLGIGVGFRVFPDDIKSLPTIKNTSFTITCEDYAPLPKDYRDENTYSHIKGDVLYVDIGDSRKGWVDAYMLVLEVATDDRYQNITQVVYNFDSIRPFGERIKGFGGTASGPDALKTIILDLHRIIAEVPGDVFRSIDCMDIPCAIAKGIVAGATRRSALICLFAQGDLLCRNAKKGLYTNPELAYKKYRSQSNNTEMFFTKPSREDLDVIFESIITEGEPGFANYAAMVNKRRTAAEKYRPNNPIEWYINVGTNPCFEIILSAGIPSKNVEIYNGVSFCNLSEQCVSKYVIYVDGVAQIDWDHLEQNTRLLTRIGIRQTNVNIPDEHMNETQLEERLLGVSGTGWRDLLDLMGWKTGSEEHKNLLIKVREWANDEADKYSAKLGINRPLLVTTSKPSGTSSKVFGCSDGLHWAWDRYIVRRVRFTSKDALAQTLLDQGVPCYPELYDLNSVMMQDLYQQKIIREDKSTFINRVKAKLKDWGFKLNQVFFKDKIKNTYTNDYYTDRYQQKHFEQSDWERLAFFDTLSKEHKRQVINSCNTIVFEFPLASNAEVSSGDVSAIEQLENMKMMSMYYCDHMPSCTVTVKHDEWEEVKDWVFQDENWDNMTNVSFMSYFDSKYPLLPNESITKEEYDRRVAAMPTKIDYDLLNRYEVLLDDPDDVTLESSCNTGLCPVR